MNSYYSRAMNDLDFAEYGLAVGRKHGDFNNVAVLSAQAGEKFLKAIIELALAEDPTCIDLMKTHNLHALCNKINTKCTMTVSSRDCKWLGDFYFEASYPGKNFVVVSKDDALECLDLAKQIKEDTDRILAEIKKERDEMRAVLDIMRAFQGD